MRNRRVLLRTAGVVGPAGLAGCTGLTDGSTDRPLPDGGTGSDDDGRDHPPDATHEARICSRADPPDLSVRPRVSLADPYVTDGSPPVLRVDVENGTDESVVVGEYRAVVFQYVFTADETFVWYPHSDRSTAGVPDRTVPDLDLADEGCWRLASGIVQTTEYGTVEIPAGGTLTAFVGLYVTHDATGVDGCVPTETARFETTYAVHDDGVIGGDDPTTAEWGFDLTVEAIDSA